MTTIIQLFFSLFLCTNLLAQATDYAKAPLNPRPLESLGFIVPSALEGDVAYYAGNYYDKNRMLLRDDGSNFMSYSEWSRNEAREAESNYLQFDDKGQLVELVKFKNSRPTTYLYEYNQKGQLVKYTFYNDVTTYSYDKKGRLETEFRTFGSSDRTVTIKYTYKNDGDLLKVFKNSIYPDGEETEEQHYKNGKKVYEKSVLGEESVCEPDARGNCVSKRNVKSNSIYKIYYNVIYREEISAKNIVLRNANKQNYGQNVPQPQIGDRPIKLPVGSIGKDAFVFIPTSNQYLIAKNFYDGKLAMDAIVPMEVLQNDNPYLGIWYTDLHAMVLKNGGKEELLKCSDDHYTFYYDETTEQYLYYSMETKGPARQLINLNKLDTEIVMYIDVEKREATTIIKGKKQTISYGWSTKPLHEEEAVLLYENKPLYIIPIVPTPEDLKIYTGRKYAGEKIPGA